LREVKSAVDATAKVGKVDIEREFLVEELQALIFGVGRVHEVDTRADVAASDEVELQAITAGSDTIST
jgi:hypothetical protein